MSTSAGVAGFVPQLAASVSAARTGAATVQRSARNRLPRAIATA
jgi:hypothetical protein